MSGVITTTPAWRKSSRSSDPQLAQCVEVAAIHFGDPKSA